MGFSGSVSFLFNSQYSNRQADQGTWQVFISWAYEDSNQSHGLKRQYKQRRVLKRQLNYLGFYNIVADITHTKCHIVRSKRVFYNYAF